MTKWRSCAKKNRHKISSFLTKTAFFQINLSSQQRSWSGRSSIPSSFFFPTTCKHQTKYFHSLFVTKLQKFNNLAGKRFQSFSIALSLSFYGRVKWSYVGWIKLELTRRKASPVFHLKTSCSNPDTGYVFSLLLSHINKVLLLWGGLSSLAFALPTQPNQFVSRCRLFLNDVTTLLNHFTRTWH